MRAIFGFFSLLLALWLVVSLLKGQLTASKLAPVPILNPLPGGQTPQQAQQAFKETLDRAMQQPRPDADGTQGSAAENKP